MYIHTFLYILYVLYIWGILVFYGGGGGTDVSVYSFCILYVLLFDDFQQYNLPIYKKNSRIPCLSW